MNKLLHNKWVVTALAVVAVAVLAVQFWPKSRSRPATTRTRSTTTTTAGTTSNRSVPAGARKTPPAATPARTGVVEVASTAPKQSADRDYLTERYEVWRRLLDRDPFDRGLVPEEKKDEVEPPASTLLTVTSLWLQTGSRLAVVNGAILGEGDKILHYKVESITYNGIWVVGRIGREQVEFGHQAAPKAAAPANASPSSNNRPSRASA